ncbi:MAG: hydrogenase maturation protease [Spirulina sp.]
MKTLVLGYGNTLRGDDGVGYCLAEAVEGWNWDNVEAYPCHQLTPDLAALIAEQERVFFVDAALPQDPHSPLILTRLMPGAEPTLTFTGHHSNPMDLLILAQQLYGQSPLAYTLLLPTWAMGYGEDLSPIAQTGLRQGLRWLKELILNPG